MAIDEHYTIESDGISVTVHITDSGEYVPQYTFELPAINEATEAVLHEIKDKLVKQVSVSIKEFVDPNEYETVKEKFRDKAYEVIDRYLPGLEDDEKQLVIGKLLHEMLGLGDLEILLGDPQLEEIVINGSHEPVWVYHKQYGWVKTNVTFSDEGVIYNYASIIARRVGKQISSLNPLLDAHLPTGDRTNATLFPISTHGNTLTIRKFARSPWTITHFIQNGTIDTDTAALLWLAVQYELNIIVSGGTGSGKTSLLNVLMPFIPPNQRIISIEDTREVRLPDFLHWVPLTTREPNPEGKGGVSMLNLLVNSLRMRPDRILVGEIRKKRQAEVLFEAMNTGHSVYSTLHADTAQQTVRRLVNPPISIPATLIDAVDLNVVMFRDRRKNMRRVMEVAEFIPEYGGSGSEASANVLYRWHPKQDKLLKEGRSMKMFAKLEMLVGLDTDAIQQEIDDRVSILKWMCNQDVHDVDDVGKVIAEFYQDPDHVKDIASTNADARKLLGSEN